MDKLLTPRSLSASAEQIEVERVTPRERIPVLRSSDRIQLTPRHRSKSATTSPRDEQRDMWFSYTVLNGPIDAMLLERWARTISMARSAGQFSCALMTLKENRDYYAIGRKFLFSIDSPLHDLEDEWTKRQMVRFKIHVPLLADIEGEHVDNPVYPRDYCRFAYLTATWFQPVNPLEPCAIDNDGVDLQGMLSSFDKIRRRAQMCGQMECALMALQGGPDYVTRDATTHILSERFTPVKHWALDRGVRLLVRVPVDPLSPPDLCDFGHLVANWQVPLGYEPNQVYREPVPEMP